jgi:hypothetical protein
MGPGVMDGGAGVGACTVPFGRATDVDDDEDEDVCPLVMGCSDCGCSACCARSVDKGNLSKKILKI